MYAEFKDEGTLTPDNLLAGDFPRVSFLVTITGGNYTRGTVLSKANDKYSRVAANGEPEAVLAENVDASEEDKQAVVYLTGEFNKAALTAGADIDTFVDKLRTKNIFVRNTQS